MGLHAVAAALALASPVAGHQTLPDGTATGPVTLLNPTTLQPVAGAPQLPGDTFYVETSPDGSQLVAQTTDSLDFFSLRTGEALGSVPQSPTVTPSWISQDRVLTVQRALGQKPAVTVIDPQTRTVLSTRRLPLGAPMVDTARVRGLQLVLGRSGKLLVLGKNGKTARTLHVTAGLLSGMDHGLVMGLTNDNDPKASTVISAVNPVSGRVRRHSFHRRLTPSYTFTPGMGKVALVQAGGGYIGIRRTDGKVVRSRFRPLDGPLVGNRDGYLVAGSTLRSVTTAGRARWDLGTVPTGYATAAIGDYIYSQEADQVRIRRRSDGSEVGVVPGVFDLQSLAIGQDANQRVRMDGEVVLDSGD